MISAPVIKMLLDSNEVTDIVNDRIYPVIIPKDELNPAIRVFVSGDVPIQSKDRKHYEHNYTHGHSYTVQIDCYLNRNQVDKGRDLANAVIDALEGNRGPWGEDEVIDMVYVNTVEDYEEESKAFRIILDFKLIIQKQ